MKFFLFAGLIFSCMVFTHCNPSKKNQKSTSQETSNPKVKLKVSFISIGQGINFEAAQYFPKFIEKFNKEHKVNLKFDIVPWGREGEMNYCFYEQKKIKEFIELSKKEMGKFENVELHEDPLHCDR